MDGISIYSFRMSPPARVVWIEITNSSSISSVRRLSPPARVVWIEILHLLGDELPTELSPPARVVWIEIPNSDWLNPNRSSPPARVVWIEIGGNSTEECNGYKRSPPARVVWIEIFSNRVHVFVYQRRHPRGWCGLKSLAFAQIPPLFCRHPRGWCGLKSENGRKAMCAVFGSPPARVVWIEIQRYSRCPFLPKCRHPRGWCGLKYSHR